MKWQLHWGEKLSPMLFRPVLNRPFSVKPFGGLWTSSFVGKSSEWIKWCERESFGKEKALYKTLLVPKRSARIATITTRDDLLCLLEKYEQPYSYLQERFLDYERLSLEYDALHLTDEGQWQTRLSFPNLYEWDCESTLWFRWCFSRMNIIDEPIFVQLPRLYT